MVVGTADCVAAGVRGGAPRAWAGRCRSSAWRFLLYGLFGQHLPGAARAPRLRLRPGRRPALTFGTEGIYGMPTYVSATYIFLFILFGAFLEQAGMISLFNDVALGIVGHTRGGPAKVCGGRLGR
ncbi:MAG: TRAP transporter large permease subunit [Chromatiales bacterium]|nr:TRAP transporter large permease subunit [Chromatiales bacterium]